MTEDLLVIVPGITGSRLRTEENEVWNLSAAAVRNGLAHTGAVLQRLRLPDGLGDEAPDSSHAVRPDGLIRGFHLWPGFWAGAGYGRLLHETKRLDPTGARTVAFAYDWRLSNRYSARLLQIRVERELSRWREQSGQADAKAVFICHSMGGLIARYYLEALGGGEIARRLITIGTPFSGSVKAVQALTGGLFKGVPGLGRLSEQLTVIARGFPSVAQLLPTYRCVASGSGPLRLADVHVPDLPDALVADADQFRRQISPTPTGAAHPNAYPIHAIVGHRQATLQSLSMPLGGGAPIFHRLQRGQDFLGDGTVPRFSSIPPDWADDANALLIPARHSALSRDAAVLEAVWNKVNALDLGEALGPDTELGLDLPEVAAAGSPFPVTVTADTSDLLLYARIEPVDGGEPVAETHVAPAEPGCYRAELLAPPGLWLVRVEAVALRPAATVEDVIFVHQP